MGRSNSEDSVLANGLNLNGLLPHEDGTVTRKLDPERWAKAESRTEELIARIQPNQSSEDHRQAVASHMERLIKECIHCQVSTFGSVPLKTYLPDGDIDLTALSMNPSLSDNWANEVRDMLKREEKNECSEFQVREVQYVQAEVKLVKCLVDNIVVDISFNQLGGLCTLCFLEEVDHLIGRNHLFKRSIILIKAWCYYESRILGAYHGLISTYALEILVLYIFHIFNNSFAGPLEVLYRFLAFFSKFDWDNFCISLWGPVPVGSFDNAAADFPRSDGGEVLLSQSFLQACSSFYSVYPRNHETLEQPFIFKFFNVVDPLRTNNNLGRSVSKGNFYRIRSAFSFGAQKLGRLMDCSEEDVIAGLNHFFSNTWERHGKGNRPDTRTLDSPLVLPGTVKINKKMNESLLSSEEDVENFRDSHGNRMAMNDTGKVFRIDSFQKKLHSIPLFARTYSSPELRITSTEALSQDRFGVKGENVQDTYASKISQKTCHSGDGEDSDWKSSGVDPSSKLVSSHGYGDGGSASHVKSTCGSTSNVSKREELASVGGAGGIPATRNMVPFPTHSLGGPVQLPVPVFGYVYQNPFGMGPRFPSVVAPYAYPQGYSPTSSSLHSTANARSSESEEGGKHHDDDDHCRWDYEEMMDERILSTSGQGISSGHESIQQPKYGMPDVIAKENCEAAGGIYDDGNRFRTDEEGNVVEHHSSNDGDEIAERMQRLNIEMPNPSVSSHVEEFQMPRYGPTHNFSNWMLPGSIPQNHLGSWQWVTGTNQQMLPIAVHPGTGPPVPFFSMVPPAPPHNLPTEIGNTGVATNLFQREEADISMVPPGLGSDAVDVADKSGDPGKSDSTNVNIASSEHSEEAASDILAGDFASHWQNLEYGRRCQNWQLPFPIFYHPPPPMYYHGNLPNYDDMGVPSPGADKPQFIPFSSNQTRTGGILHQSGGFPMRRGGTGTYLPNQGNMGVRQPPSPRHYRANFNDENREQHHWDREEKWSQNSKPRFANRQRYQSEKNTRTYRPMGRNGRNERQWYGYRDNNYCPPRHHPSNGVNAPSDPVENQKSESVVGSVASTTRGRGQTYFPPDQPSPIFGSVSDHIA